MQLHDPTCSCFLHQYMFAQGTSKVPSDYHWWCAVSTIAACVANRVWAFKGAERIQPNLYTLLIGPSGIGKGSAIKEALRLINGIEGINPIPGKITGPFLMDYLSGRHAAKGAPPNLIYLVCEELAFSFTEGQQARDLVKTLVALYGGNVGDMPFYDGTRTGGLIAMKRACINFLAGTTEEWLVQALPSDTVAGGFSRRIVAVDREHTDVEQLAYPVYPKERDSILATLKARCVRLTQLEGEMYVTADAVLRYEEWFYERPKLEDLDPLLHPWWSTQDELAYKLAMLFALAYYEDRQEMTITGTDMVHAWQQTQEMKDHVLRAIRHTFADKESKDIAWARYFFEMRGRCTDRLWQQNCSARHILSERRGQLEETLMGAGEIRWYLTRDSRSVKWWEWMGHRKMFLGGKIIPPESGATVEVTGVLLPAAGS